MFGSCMLLTDVSLMNLVSCKFNSVCNKFLLAWYTYLIDMTIYSYTGFHYIILKYRRLDRLSCSFPECCVSTAVFSDVHDTYNKASVIWRSISSSAISIHTITWILLGHFIINCVCKKCCDFQYLQTWYKWNDMYCYYIECDTFLLAWYNYIIVFSDYV